VPSAVPFSTHTSETLFLLILSILAIKSADSIRSLYRHFLSNITKKSLNAFYYACSYAKADFSNFMNVTAAIALNMIPKDLFSQPVFLCIDDTMVTKFGKMFENVSKLFDHAAHNGSNYLNGHCFVSLMLCVSLWNKNTIHYLSVPLGYRMWQKKESKLELAASMVRQVMPTLSKIKKVIILCDRWYVKKNLVSIVDEYENLDLIGNARSDSVIYDLPPQHTWKKGRPAARGSRLSIWNDFVLSDEKIGDYYTAVRRVLTNIFGHREVMAYVTSPTKDSGTRRLFFQYDFSRTAGDFLCMGRKVSIKPDRKRLDAVYSPVVICIEMEHRGSLLRTENILVIMQLYGTQPERNRNAG